MGSQGQSLFKNVVFYIDEHLDSKTVKKIETLLSTHGGIPYHASTVPTHFITNSPKPRHKMIIKFQSIKPVTPNWVTSSIRCNTLFNPNYYCPEIYMPMSGLIIGVTDELIVSDREKLFGMILALGGQFRSTTDHPDLTHIIGISPLKEGNRNVKVMLPHWVEDCLGVKKRVPESPYAFPDPPILLSNYNPLTYQFRPEEYDLNSPNLLATTTLSNLYFLGQVIYFHPELGLSKDVKNDLIDQIKLGGGIESDEFKSDVTVLICQSRESDDFYIAYEKGMTIGTLTWLYHTIHTQMFLSTNHQLLFYPTLSAPMSNMKSLIISITNYSHSSKEYMKRLIHGLGATYTPYLSANNTHLICASPTGSKFDKASDWNVVVVNHLWLEDSYRKWCAQPVSKPIYTYYPIGLPLDLLVGQAPYKTDDHLGPPCDIIEFKLNEKVETVPASDDEMDKISEKGSFNNKETFQRHSSRAAASMASNALAKLMEAQNSFEKSAGSRLKNFSAPAPKLDKVIEANAVLPIKPKSILIKGTPKIKAMVKEVEVGVKRKLTGTTPKPSPRVDKKRALGKGVDGEGVKILFTGIKPSPDEKKSIKSMGGKLAQDATECTHLIASSAARTSKFLCCISLARSIVSKAWLDNSIKAGTFLDESEYLLDDQHTEQLFQFKLSKSIALAKKFKLLEGYTLFITPNTQPAIETLTEIINAGGGKVVQPFPTKRQIQEILESPPSSNNLIILTDNKDNSYLQSRLGQTVIKSLSGRFFSPELVLNATLHQKLDWFGYNIRI